MPRGEEPPFDLEDLLRRYGSSPPNLEVPAPLLTVLKSEIKPSTPASFHNFQALKVAIGLNANHFHKFW